MSGLRRHASSSHEQSRIEGLVRARLARELRLQFSTAPGELDSIRLDGYASGARPVLLEIFAHVGPCKGGQRNKVAKDMAKLLLAERLLGRARVRKLIAFVCEDARSVMLTGWLGLLAREFRIEPLLVRLPAARVEELRAVQRRQYR